MPTVEIRRNADGLVRKYEDDCEWQEGSDYLWGDGNYACDCNRSLFFARAVGDDDDSERPPCGGELYSVRITGSAGNVLYSDGEWP
jgi:hypothetical protein